jgi:UDP-N-acetylglucosamine 2-epimerase (non-hydrolysing)
VYPVHLNPNVRKFVSDLLGNVIGSRNILNTRALKNILLLEPIEYLSFIYLMKKSIFVLTDSGGIQEEAPGLGKPVLVMRDTTERPEGVEAETVKLIGTNKEVIVNEVNRLLQDKIYYNMVSTTAKPYGNGTAEEKIRIALLSN